MKKILVLTDFSDLANAATETAFVIAQSTDSEVLLYNTFYPLPMFTDGTSVYPYFEEYQELEKANIEQMKSLTERIRKEFQKQPAEAGTVFPKASYKTGFGYLGENVKNLLDTENIWLIVMGDKREGRLNRFIFGTDAGVILRTSTVPVLLVPDSLKSNAFKKIALGWNCEMQDIQTLKFLSGFARIFKAELTLTHVCHPDDGSDVEEKLKNELSRWRKGSGSEGLKFKQLRSEDVASSLASFAEVSSIDLLAVVHRKLSFWDSLFRRSTTQDLRVLHKIPVLVIPDPVNQAVLDKIFEEDRQPA